MGLMQRAYETYCAMEEKYAGVYDATKKEPLAPVGHILTKAQIEITLDKNGVLVNAADVSKEDGKILIPVTEESAGRTSAPVAHPLCEQLTYLAQYDAEKYGLYVEQLKSWAESQHSHNKLLAVLNYIESGTILSDLANRGLIKLNEKGIPEKEKLLVRWRILDGGNTPECWKDKTLFKAFTDYYASIRTSDPTLCMVTGEVMPAATQHAKGIVSFNGNAKLISANDSSGFTYRGRFTDDSQALGISYDASQKAHNALRWVISNDGVSIGGRTFICWNPQGFLLKQPHSPLLRNNETVIQKMSEYKRELEGELLGFQTKLGPDTSAVVASFDAATTGRLALTYYCELPYGDFLERLCKWDETCCWFNGQFGIQSPSLIRIAETAFGTPRTENKQTKFVADDRVLREQVQRLISCRVDGAKLPLDIVRALVAKASNLGLLDSAGAKESLLHITCAVIRKYHIDYYREEFEMALEPEKKDISYQYGRLLAVLEKAERDTYDGNESREPNAIRLQSAFTQRPLHTFRLILEKVKNGYYPRIKPSTRNYYEKLTESIMGQISEFPDDMQNTPLKDTYLIGYYLQKKTMYQPKAEETEE